MAITRPVTNDSKPFHAELEGRAVHSQPRRRADSEPSPECYLMTGQKRGAGQIKQIRVTVAAAVLLGSGDKKNISVGGFLNT